MTITFETQRLVVTEVTDDMTALERNTLIEKIPNMLTPSVVKNLPEQFQGITCSEGARAWLDSMVVESRLLQVKSKQYGLVGFFFAYEENWRSAHIGYLLAEPYWRQGLASELLQGFVDAVTDTESWVRLIAGVAQSNASSANLLLKQGFVQLAADKNDVIFYQYTIQRS